MEYTADELTAAFAADEVARYERMQFERGPDYAVLSLEDNERDVDTLSPDDVDGAAFELAAERGMDPAAVLDLVDAVAGGERDTATRAYAVAVLAATDDEALALTVSAEKREQLADKGKGYALPDGAYPIADAKHLGVAKAYYKQGKLAGHPASVVRAHINKAAARLGLPGWMTTTKMRMRPTARLPGSASRSGASPRCVGRGRPIRGPLRAWPRARAEARKAPAARDQAGSWPPAPGA